MDDILKRMLAVEDEAEKIVRQAEQKAEDILEEARKNANQLYADAQNKLADEMKDTVQIKVQEALDGKEKSLQAEKERIAGDIQRFQEMIRPKQEMIVKSLLFGIE